MREMAVKAQKIISESGLSLKDALEKLIKKSQDIQINNYKGVYKW